MPIYGVIPADPSLVLMELGAIVVGLAILARLAHRLGLSAIPLYLLAGLAFGNGGIAPLRFTEEFVHVAAEMGVILLLFMLGLEYTGEELQANLRTALPAGLLDFALNFPPGLIAGLLLGWGVLASVLLGGVTYVSSSGVIAKVLAELKRQNNPETPTVLSVLVLEDLAMAVYLPLVSVLLVGRGPVAGAVSVLVALVTVGVVLFVAVRFGKPLSRLVGHHSDEILLLTTLGIVLVVAGVAQRLQVSAAVGAFLVGVGLSGPLVGEAHRLVAPLRDLFAAIFFFFFSLQIDPATLVPVFWLAAILGLVTSLTKVAAGWWAARRAGVGAPGRWRAGTILIARGEFSIVIASLGAALEPELGPLSAAYVLLLAVLGPVLTRALEPWTAGKTPEKSKD
jgi:CPA2 family monovalent cation:H+ antiporter-2